MKMMRSVFSLYHPCCRPGLWIVWVSMISGTCPHRSHSSLEHAWILTNDEIRCGQSRPGPWILWLAMVGGTYPHRLRLDPWISWISMGGGTYPHRRHLDLWISWILNGRTYPHRYHFDPWISWISMGGGTYPHRRHLGHGSALILTIDEFLHRSRRGPWNALILMIDEFHHGCRRGLDWASSAEVVLTSSCRRTKSISCLLHCVVTPLVGPHRLYLPPSDTVVSIPGGW